MSESYPESISVVVLTQGYVVGFRGQQLAVATPKQAGDLIKKKLLELQDERSHQPAYAVAPMPQAPTPPNAGLVRVPAQGQTRPGADAPDVPTANLDISRKNLTRLARGRVDGEMGDREYFELCAQHAPGLTEEEYVDALDAMFTAETEDTPETRVLGLPVGLSIVADVSPSDLVEDFVTDETGREVPEEWLYAQTAGA